MDERKRESSWTVNPSWCEDKATFRPVGRVALQKFQCHSDFMGSGQNMRPGLIPQGIQYKGHTAYSRGAQSKVDMANPQTAPL